MCRAAHPSGCARCGAGAACSAKYQLLPGICDEGFEGDSEWKSSQISALQLFLKILINAEMVGSLNSLPSHPQGHSPVGGVPREQKMLKGHLPRVIYHQVLVYEDELTDMHHGPSIATSG